MASKIIDILAAEYAATGSRQPIRAHIVADAVADLPTVDHFDGYSLQIGSTADVIRDGTRYALDSAGAWFQQLHDVGADVYTKSQIDTMLAAYATTAALNAAEAALTAAINTRTTSDDIFRGTVINSNSDLNDYTTPGRFFVPNSTIAATISNTPVTGAGFTLEIFANAAAAPSNVVQVITKISRVMDSRYMRAYVYSSGVYSWQSWYKITATQV